MNEVTIIYIKLGQCGVGLVWYMSALDQQSLLTSQYSTKPARPSLSMDIVLALVTVTVREELTSSA